MISRIVSFAAATAALALIAGPVAVAEFPSEPPAAAEPKPFSLPASESYELDNGTRVTLVPYGRVPKTTVRVVVRSGNLNDGELTWIADLTARMMEEGADGQSAADVAVAASGMGGSLNIGVGLDQTTATMDVLSDSVTDAIQLLAGVVRRPTLPGSEFERVRSAMVRDLSVSRSQPQSIASTAFHAELYPDHPYGRWLPEEGKLESYTLDQVKAYHAENFGGARTHIYVVGQYDSEAVKAAIGDAFGSWPAGAPPLELKATAPSTPRLIIIDRSDAPQSTLRLGKRVDDLDGDIAPQAMNTLLGGYFSSRITRNIREDKGYTYSPNSSFGTRAWGRNWQQNADVTAEATGASLVEIYNEIDRIRNEAPSDEEVQGIKNYLNGIFVLQLASRGGVANRLGFVNLHDLGIEYLESYVSKVQALEGEDFSAAARQMLDPSQMTLVVVGPEADVRAQLAELSDRLPPE